MIVLDDKIDFTANMIPLKTHEMMQYCTEKTRKV